MARTPRSRAGPFRSPHTGVVYSSQYQYRVAELGYREKRRQEPKQRERRQRFIGGGPTRVGWHDAGLWRQYGQEGGPPLRGRPALTALASEVRRLYGEDAGIVVSWYANGAVADGSEFVNTFEWKSVRINSDNVQAVCSRLLREGETGVEGPASFVRTVTEGYQNPTEVQAFQIRRARG